MKEEAQVIIHKDLLQNDSASGGPFVGENCDLDSDHILIYGQNTKNGTMLAPLLNYKDESYWINYPLVSYGKRLIRLSTCKYSVKDGRFGVVA